MQQNWAVIRATRSGRIEIIFFHDGTIVFDKLPAVSRARAEADLRRNGFLRYDDPKENFSDLIAKPSGPFRMGRTSKHPIYSGGEYWR